MTLQIINISSLWENYIFLNQKKYVNMSTQFKVKKITEYVEATMTTYKNGFVVYHHKSTKTLPSHGGTLTLTEIPKKKTQTSIKSNEEENVQKTSTDYVQGSLF